MGNGVFDSHALPPHSYNQLSVCSKSLRSYGGDWHKYDAGRERRSVRFRSTSRTRHHDQTPQSPSSSPTTSADFESGLSRRPSSVFAAIIYALMGHPDRETVTAPDASFCRRDPFADEILLPTRSMINRLPDTDCPVDSGRRTLSSWGHLKKSKLTYAKALGSLPAGSSQFRRLRLHFLPSRC